MTYDFSLEKKAALILTLGLALIGILLFVAGWLAGSQYALNTVVTPAVRPAAGQVATVNPAAGQPALPAGQAAPATVGVLPADGSSIDPTLLPPGVAPIAVEPLPEVAAGQPPAATNAGAAKPEAVAPAGALKNEAQNPAAASDGDAVVVKEAAPAAADASAGTTANSVFSVQVGAFLEATDAEKLAKELQNRGYTPNIFSGNDGELRQWYAVRIGVYADPKEAAEAASNFSKQEKMKAAVRPIDSL